MRSSAVVLVLLLLIVAPSMPCFARPRILVALADHLQMADMTRADTPNMARLWHDGARGLMSPGLAHSDDPVSNVWATLGAGDSISPGDLSQGRLGTALEAAHLQGIVIGNADGDDTGLYRPSVLLLPATQGMFADTGTRADPLAAGGVRIDPARLTGLTAQALNNNDLVIVHDGDFDRIEREDERGDLAPVEYKQLRQEALVALDQYLGAVSDFAQTKHIDLLFVVPVPPIIRGKWDSLTPVLYVSGTPMPGLLSSDTTQTPGLVAARDLAPTVLTLLNVPLPIQMTGAPFRTSRNHSDQADATLSRLDRLTRLNQDAQNPLFWGLGFLGAAILFAGLVLFLTGSMAHGVGMHWASMFGLRVLAAWSLALLFAPLTQPATLPVYFAWICGLTILIALLPSPPVIFGLTALMLIADSLLGTGLVAQSVLSVYPLAGIRFYGIGNEYMGVLIGGALLLATFARSDTRAAGVGIGLWFGLVVFVLSFPAYGAKAGGAVTAVTTFVIAWRRLQGLPVRWTHGAAGLAAGFLIVFAWALAGHWLPIRRTHIDTAVGALGHGRFGYIAGVAVRKVGLAARVTLHPGTLLGLVGLAITAVAGRLFLQRQVREYLSSHPRFAAVWAAGLWGCLLCIGFNDSGIVAAILLFSCLLLSLLHGLYGDACASPHST